ncbi:MAG: lysylphosphatidylglycerol synthase domain-containing protein [Chloroflexota bacterium]
MIQWLRKRLSVRVVVPSIIALGMLVYVATLASAPQSGRELWRVFQQTWILILFLTFPYLLARALVWYRLMSQLGVEVPWRQAAVSFAGGEMTKSLPGGIYVENYILGRLVHFGRHSLIRSSMATTAMLGLEALVAVPTTLIIGVPGERWLFWAILGIVIFWLVMLVLAWVLVHHIVPHGQRRSDSRLHRAATVADEFLHAGADLLTLETLFDGIPTALYMLIYAIDLYAILLALNVHSITFVDTLVIYAIVVLAVILVPIPTEIGISEFTGLGVLLAFGTSRSVAALAVLSLRVLATGFTIVVAGLILFVLRHELSRLLPTSPETAVVPPVEQVPSPGP